MKFAKRVELTCSPKKKVMNVLINLTVGIQCIHISNDRIVHFINCNIICQLYLKKAEKHGKRNTDILFTRRGKSMYPTLNLGGVMLPNCSLANPIGWPETQLNSDTN